MHKNLRKIDIIEEIRIPGTDIILEVGDRIEVIPRIAESASFSNILRMTGSAHDGAAYVVFYTIEYIEDQNLDAQEAFALACENENLYGNRSDVVSERKLAANVLKQMEGYIVDPILGF